MLVFVYIENQAIPTMQLLKPVSSTTALVISPYKIKIIAFLDSNLNHFEKGVSLMKRILSKTVIKRKYLKIHLKNNM